MTNNLHDSASTQNSLPLVKDRRLTRRDRLCRVIKSNETTAVFRRNPASYGWCTVTDLDLR